MNETCGLLAVLRRISRLGRGSLCEEKKRVCCQQYTKGTDTKEEEREEEEEEEEEREEVTGSCINESGYTAAHSTLAFCELSEISELPQFECCRTLPTSLQKFEVV